MTAPGAQRAGPGAPTVPEQGAFREVMGHFATGVVAVTGLAGHAPAGLAVNSFTSVSLAPPLVSFCVARTSRTWPRIRGTGLVCVNILHEDQRDISRRMATSGGDKFRGLTWTDSPSGLPLIDGVIGWLECAVDDEHPAGDHAIVVARVRHMEARGADRPLVFYRGGYSRLTALPDKKS
ncbi:flavin reductase family protein [Streptomyces albiaxialis]|uniref:Flavin reductase family protein n=1 Tax=Streptomyces albiaxialis TaxID=329523 RepID=A0ABN2WWV7_9ACTN